MMIDLLANRILGKLLEFGQHGLSLPRGYKRMLVMLFDAGLCLASIWLAFSLRLGVWLVAPGPMLKVALAALPLWFAASAYTDIYRAVFRYAGAGTMIRLTVSCAIFGMPMVVIFLAYGIHTVPRTIGALQPIFFLILLATSRILGRYVLFDLLNAKDNGAAYKRALIYGIGSNGQQLASSARIDGRIAVLGFLTADVQMIGRTIDGLGVFDEANLSTVVQQHGITDILVAFEGESRTERAAVLKRLEPADVHIRALPPMRDLVDKDIDITALREIELTDLLGREPVKPRRELLDANVAGKTVLVTGGGGSIGGELARQIAKLEPAKLVIVESSELNLFLIDRELRKAAASRSAPLNLVPEIVDCSDRAAIERTIMRHRPETIFHAAAYKHVPLIETNVVSGVRNNVLGTYYAALAALGSGVRNFVLVSTDKAVRPTNVMGRSKRMCELVLQGIVDRQRADPELGPTVFSMVRFGNVLGSSGSVVPYFEQQIRDGGPVTVTHLDMTRYFMTIPEASQLVIQAGSIARGGEVFVLDMGEPVKIVDLARSMISLAGLTERTDANPEGDIEIVEVGLRPGEKMFEELFIGTTHELSAHPGIMMARELYLPWSRLEKCLAEIEAACRAGNAGELRTILNEVVLETSSDLDQTASASKREKPILT